ncbi:porin [Mucilaginibacter sp. RS28]|uniref:Porin n=1 Tax=Mucilaginibacter straminoryzae TaxID=2932774 RepID=A0A9X2BCJ4_9SPHI|nr:porin [Mucilaginibacter straminoryzae]MCJ8210977.1 porin [Mucilaginibacter straminoryzae]
MKKQLLLISFLASSFFAAKAQDTAKVAPAPPLTVYGSVDAYYKYDFSGHSNIPTSFANEQNSFSIGMVDLGLKKKVGKAAFVGEVSFGPRGQSQSIPNAEGVYDEKTNSFHIQNLYVSYDLTDKFNVTGGYMATFVGYEVISPAGNFNYSTSYLFTNGPFQNAGVKFTYTFSDRVSLMAGLFNDKWNVYQAAKRINTFGAQLMVVPVKNWTAYLNLLSGPASGTELDLTTNYQLTSAFKLGLNAATFDAPDPSKGGFSGVALYPQLAVSSAVTLGLRGEYFKTKAGDYALAGPAPGKSVTGLTFTANIKSGGLTFIPEIRLDHNKESVFMDSNGKPSQSAAQFLMAAVYAF